MKKKHCASTFIADPLPPDMNETEWDGVGFLTYFTFLESNNFYLMSAVVLLNNFSTKNDLSFYNLTMLF
jgi:hypothetical protein